MKGCVFAIEEFSVYDGPGIRSTVFLKGCPLKCSWCHNPEGQCGEIQIVRSPNGCTMCNKCIDNAHFCGDIIRYTEKSIMACPNNLLRYSGKLYETDELCAKLLKNKSFYKDGGITFSGGEPFFQTEFLFECLYSLKGQLHTAIQTSGFCPPKVFSKALNLADYFLFDIKIINKEKHKRYVGESNDNILYNFKQLAKSDKPFMVRIPLIPGVTDTKENIIDICHLLNKNGVKTAELLPYHKFAGSKYKLVGRKYTPDFDESVEVCHRENIFREYNIDIKIL